MPHLQQAGLSDAKYICIFVRKLPACTDNQPGPVVNDRSSLARRYRETRTGIESLAGRYRRSPDSITLVAVSKRHSAGDVFRIACMGHRHFAENFVQEGAGKIAEVRSRLETAGQDTKLTWHFIGHIQSRKCRDIAHLFDWVHTIESDKVANRLNRFREGCRPLNVLIQMNLQHEAGKSGISEDQLEDLARTVSAQPNLKLRGLMIIPRPESDLSQQRKIFRRMNALLRQDWIRPYGLDQLSMGMSGDLEAAIAEGATMVRLGTAIFGPRPD